MLKKGCPEHYLYPITTYRYHHRRRRLCPLGEGFDGCDSMRYRLRNYHSPGVGRREHYQAGCPHHTRTDRRRHNLVEPAATRECNLAEVAATTPLLAAAAAGVALVVAVETVLVSYVLVTLRSNLPADIADTE